MCHDLQKIHNRLKKVLTKEFLKNEYFIKRKSTIQIAKEVGCHYCVIGRYLKKFGMKTNQSKIRKGKKLNTRLVKIFTKDYLYNEYILKDRTSNDIANEHNTVHEVVLRYLRKFNIQIRNSKQAGIKGGIRAEKHWNWLGGCKSNGHTYIFRKKRHLIIERDNFICQNCGMTKEEHFVKFNCDFNVHHIDYNKENDNDNNLITLCKSCHGFTHKTKQNWKRHFNQKIKEKSI